jgi:hypothetical protein
MVVAHTLLLLLYIAVARGQQQANPARNDDRLGLQLDNSRSQDTVPKHIHSHHNG